MTWQIRCVGGMEMWSDVARGIVDSSKDGCICSSTCGRQLCGACSAGCRALAAS
jgi:hypothetical protein